MEYVYEYQFEKSRGYDYSDEFFWILQRRNRILKTKKTIIHGFHYFSMALAAAFIFMLSILFGAETDSDFYLNLAVISIYVAAFNVFVGSYLFLAKLCFRKKYAKLNELSGILTLYDDTITDKCDDTTITYKQAAIKRVVIGREVIVFFVDKRKPFIILPRVDFKEETFLKELKEVYKNCIVYWKRVS